MKIDFESILKTLGLPVTLVLVISGVLAMLGLSLVQILQIASSLIGVALLITLVINVGKWAGIVDDGTSGKWSAVLHLLALIGIGGALYVNPAFDFVGVDAKLGEFARVAGVVFIYVTQIISSKQLQSFMTNNMKLKLSTSNLQSKARRAAVSS